jgi:hypothetical protein
MVESTPSVAAHFAGRSPAVRQVYDRILEVCQAFGPFDEDPKKTSIHLNRKSAFAGVATRKELLLLTIKAEDDIPSPRIAKRERASSRRWHLEVKLRDPEEVDGEIAGWLQAAYLLSA